MRIHKIINNNAVLTIDHNNNEVIALGNGIGWNRSINDIIDLDRIDQLFVLKDKTYDYVMRVLKRVSPQALEIAASILEKGNELLGHDIDEQLVFTLADHITFSIDSYHQGKSAPNLIVHEVRLLYPVEYKIGQYGVGLINERLDIELSEDEVGYIALHLVNAGLSESNEDVNMVISLTQDITQIIKEKHGNIIDDESSDYIRFLTHIKYLARRVTQQDRTRFADVDDLLPILVKKEKKIIKTVEKISDFIEEKYQYKLEKEDEIYLIIHILRIIK